MPTPSNKCNLIENQSLQITLKICCLIIMAQLRVPSYHLLTRLIQNPKRKSSSCQSIARWQHLISRKPTNSSKENSQNSAIKRSKNWQKSNKSNVKKLMVPPRKCNMTMQSAHCLSIESIAINLS
jgi:hypothetical protein